MKYIKEIEIRYFRSIYNLKLKEVEKCTIFSGKNDSGKSNVLKALNLFFNNKTDWQTSFNFQSDFNLDRLSEVREESVKGKQFIQISITFNRGNNYINTLPETFTVKKQWDRYSLLPKVSDDLEQQLTRGKIKNDKINIIRRSLTGFMNKINFEYVPAIKDKRLFDHVLNLLQKDIIELSIKKGQHINDDIINVSNKFQSNVEDLSLEFKKSTEVDTVVSLPGDPSELFQVLNVTTKFGETNEYNVPINNRGDGIRLRYLPSLFNYLAQNHNGYYILGFEEPENSMELGLSTKMAKDFQVNYSKNAQIFITSHSSAFLFCYTENSILYRIYKDKNYTKSSKLRITEDSLQLEDDTSPDYKLREEIGLTQLQKIFHKQYAQKLDDYELKISQIERLEQEVANTKKPVLFTEGKTDVVILNTAWEKLDSTVEKPFEILPVESTEIDGGDGGYSSLNRKLESVRKDEKLQIGIYDNDEAGNSKGFQKLNKNFIMYNNNPFIKIHKNNRAIAIILPIPKGLDEFAKHKNLQIEFYFNEVVINKKINGKGLLLEPFQFNLPFRGETIETIVRTEIYLSKINSDTKKYFSEVIVPSLDKESFINFKPLFEIICSLILKYQN
jgi:AAA15 family ATPase/GTPase